MARKLIATIHNGPHFVKVYRDSEWQEWIAILDGKEATSYHTNDKADAIKTAEDMARRAVAADVQRFLSVAH